MTLIEQLTAVITAIGKDISNNSGNSGGSSSDNSALLLRKIGEKWYKSGLRHSAEYPHPYPTAYSYNPTNGAQYFTPFTALEDATITSLEINCTTAQSNATVSLGIYASDSNNDVADPLFTSAPISCNATGAKNASCNVQIKKGGVYWLSSLSIGSSQPSFPHIDSSILFPIKGAATASASAIIGYYTTDNKSMQQSAPTNKKDLFTKIPRVLFITG